MSSDLPEPVVYPGADVDERASVGAGTVVWHLAQVREGANIGEECIIGRGAYVDTGVVVGHRCKIQNHALVYAPAQLADGVFVGPAAVFTNDEYPRSVTPQGALKRGDDWEAEGVTVEEGASVGARAVVLPSVTIGRWSLVAAGAVVTKDVPPFAVVVGSPARQAGWVGKAGVPLVKSDEGLWRCPVDETAYRETSQGLVEAP